jgi:hypothetical protein
MICFVNSHKNIAIMESTLTLNMEPMIFEKIKNYASARKMSLSNMVETYLQSLVTTKTESDDIEISPFVRSLSCGVKIPANLNYKKEYSDYLMKKYK